MARRIDSLSASHGTMERMMEPYRGIDTIANFSSALRCLRRISCFRLFPAALVE